VRGKKGNQKFIESWKRGLIKDTKYSQGVVIFNG
jgi:hypothetical protein